MTRDDTMVNAFVPGAANLSPEEMAMIDRRRGLLGPAYRLFYQTPLHVVRGQGVWLYDKAGDAYLDVYNNVASVGHCHPHVVAAMAQAAGTLATHTRYLQDGVLDYAERLLATFPGELGHVMFTCTGSEANDLAIRLTRARTGGTGFIVTENAYHGVTLAVAEMSPSLGRSVDLGVHVRTVPAPAPGVDFTAAVQVAIADLQRHGIKPAALIVDTIFSSDGVYADPPGFLTGAVQAIRAAGGLFIADEVQPGFGRLGDTMWGFQRHGVVPDLVSLGKPMGNGYPVAGLVMRPDVVAEFGAKARYFNTFGGNAVAAATAMAVLEVVQGEGLQDNARSVGRLFRSGLDDLASRHPHLGSIRSAGLFLGVDIVTDGAPDAEKTGRIVNALREARVLISATGPQGHVLKIRPPLVFSTQNVDFFLDRFDRVLRATD
jgi:4-aminobutyrate aminotransferase-like enzyme